MGPGKNEISTRIPSDFMYQECQFFYFLNSATSKKCGTTTQLDSPPNGNISTLNISKSQLQTKHNEEELFITTS